MSVEEILEGSTFPKDEVNVCMRQDLVDELERLRTQRIISAASGSGDVRLGRPQPDTSEVDDQIEELERQMEASTLTFHMQGIASGEYNIIQRTSGKPRNGSKIDNQMGFNTEAFYQKAIKRCCYKVTSPDGDEVKFTDKQWEKLFSRINDGQMDQFCGSVEKVNRRAARGNPTRGLSFGSANGSGQMQPQLTESESQSSGSEDGSLSEPQQS